MLTTVAAGRVFNHTHCLGMYAGAGQGFWAPFDFAFGNDGMIYVVNRGSEELGQRITRCTIDHEYLGQFGAYGNGDGQFIWPVSLDLDQDENIYVADDYLNRITIFDKQGQFLDKWGQAGSGEGELRGPSGIALDNEDNVYVVDSHNNRVQKFTKDGRLLGNWGGPGSGEGEFDSPWGICLDGQGDVYVADWKNSRVQKFSPNGAFLAQFRGADSGVGALNRPAGVAVDSDGDVYVTDWGAHRLNIYSPDGAFVTTLVGDAVQPSPWAQTYIAANQDMIKARRRADMEPEYRFRRPVAVNVDAENNIWISEATRHRFQIYAKEKEYEEHPLNL